MNERTLARGIGWLSLAMGLTLLAPAKAARLFGLGDRPLLMGAIGARDLTIGLGLLGRKNGASWLRAQALADVADATLVGAGVLTGAFARGRGATWLVVALGSGCLSSFLAHRLDEQERFEPSDLQPAQGDSPDDDRWR